MNIFLWILAILAAYFFLIFIVLRLAVPFMGFSKWKEPKEIPAGMKEKITELESQSQNGLEYLEKVYNFVIARWHAGRMNTIFYAPLAFRTNLEKIWETPGYSHCHTQNYVVFLMLVKSKFFKVQDINTQCVFFNMFIHQYLKVKMGERTISVDPAGASIHGKPLGEHISFFG